MTYLDYVLTMLSYRNLSYAKANRAEWIARGQEVVAEMVGKLEKEDKKADEKEDENPVGTIIEL